MVEVTLHQAGDVRIGRICLNRPEKKNALTPAMLGELNTNISQVGKDASVHAILLEGSGAAFCSGFDLSLCKDDDSVLGKLLTGLAEAIKYLRACPMPVVIAAHGAAIAGGCALLGGGDLVVSHNDAKIGYPVVRLGISPAVSAPFLAGSIGHGHARERQLDSSLISGWEAYRLGLVHDCIDDAGRVREHALHIAVELGKKPGPAIRATKKLLMELDMDAGHGDRGLEASLGIVGSSEQRERLSAVWKS